MCLYSFPGPTTPSSSSRSFNPRSFSPGPSFNQQTLRFTIHNQRHNVQICDTWMYKWMPTLTLTLTNPFRHLALSRDSKAFRQCMFASRVFPQTEPGRRQAPERKRLLDVVIQEFICVPKPYAGTTMTGEHSCAMKYELRISILREMLYELVVRAKVYDKKGKINKIRWSLYREQPFDGADEPFEFILRGTWVYRSGWIVTLDRQGRWVKGLGRRGDPMNPVCCRVRQCKVVQCHSVVTVGIVTQCKPLNKSILRAKKTREIEKHRCLI
ncbi:hypothetical protein KQX54_010166 [Cotesia glomerata]|uniref:Uncharacterized protein n=1 Tax=Cotesia glomerata TaxID=32391 RepID=A0AAV7J6Q4_COTGL|nr:hypothetical protein KQX54_010166 [Cotesia glomerata]